ncbi:mucin-2-like [Cherax quadricarinatus]|uniref:mucin-2-like n=1 Tax=Cherax quadricarinatus TaxID=27406 RepID=UPI00387EA84B
MLLIQEMRTLVYVMLVLSTASVCGSSEGSSSSSTTTTTSSSSTSTTSTSSSSTSSSSTSSSSTTSSSSSSSTRHKRFFYVNPSAPTLLALLLTVPMSLALPTLLTYKDRSLDTTLIYKDATLPEDLLWDPGYTQPLTRLSFYFNHLDLPLVSCQERFICELAADPSTFSPFDQLFLKELRHVYGPVTSSPDSLMWRYMSAARQTYTNLQGCLPYLSSGCQPSLGYVSPKSMEIHYHQIQCKFILKGM